MCLFEQPATMRRRTCCSRTESVRSLCTASEVSRSPSVSLLLLSSAVRTAARRTLLSNGFSMKSTAPNFIASTARGMSPCPVIMITGMADFMAFKRRCRSRAFPTLSEPVELPQRRACSLMWFRLGRVDGFDDDEAEGESDERAEVRVGFLATEGDALEA